MSKYYTPKIEEFHVGFRYELLTDPYIYQTWDKLICYKDKVVPSLFLTEDDSCRVKYLDQADIEELGWEYSGKTTEHWFTMVKTIQPFNLTYRSFRLSYNFDDHRLAIWGFEYATPGNTADEETLFLGNVINYNELKTVMKMLGI